MRQRYRFPVAACLLVLVFAASCGTFHVRDVQRQFNAAVAADNSQAAQGMGPIGAIQLYEDVRAELPDATIAKLPARLQATAYAMRAVSEWRSGALAAARDSAARGLALPDVASSPRDRVMMQLIDPLVILDDVQRKFRKAGETVTLATYQRDYAADLKTAWNALGTVLASPDPALPEDVGYYARFQRWRLLQQWRIIIASIQNDDDLGSALASAKGVVGLELKDAAEQERKHVPAGHPLRVAMDALGRT